MGGRLQRLLWQLGNFLRWVSFVVRSFINELISGYFSVLLGLKFVKGGVNQTNVGLK